MQWRQVQDCMPLCSAVRFSVVCRCAVQKGAGLCVAVQCRQVQGCVPLCSADRCIAVWRCAKQIGAVLYAGVQCRQVQRCVPMCSAGTAVLCCRVVQTGAMLCAGVQCRQMYCCVPICFASDHYTMLHPSARWCLSLLLCQTCCDPGPHSTIAWILIVSKSQLCIIIKFLNFLITRWHILW